MRLTSKDIATAFPPANLSALPSANPGSGKPWIDPTSHSIIVGALGTFGMSQTTADARYLQLSGGALTGGLGLRNSPASDLALVLGRTASDTYDKAGLRLQGTSGSFDIYRFADGVLYIDGGGITLRDASYNKCFESNSSVHTFYAGNQQIFRVDASYATAYRSIFSTPASGDNLLLSKTGTQIWWVTAEADRLSMGNRSTNSRRWELYNDGGMRLYGGAVVDDYITAGGNVTASGYQAIGYSPFTTGAGMEMHNVGGTGYLIAYNHATSAYIPMVINASTLAISAATTFASAVELPDMSKVGGLRFIGSSPINTIWQSNGGVDLAINTNGGKVILGAGSSTNHLQIDTSGYISIAGTQKLGAFTVATLPSPSANNRAEANVSDSSVTTFGSTVVGGGSASVKVRSNGTNWTVCGI